MKLSFEELADQIEDWFFVETKDSQIIPFILNVIQLHFIRLITGYKNKYPDRPLRVLILKGRQFGFSTLLLAIFFCKCLIVPNTRCAVISHDHEATKKLFRRVRFFAKTLLLKPSLDKESEREYSFPKTNSYFYIGTAGSKSFGRGDNLTDVHCSEVAFWPNAAHLMNGLVQAVGMTGNIFIETTANGVGNYLNKLWKKSYQNINSSWFAIFFKWSKFLEYEMNPGPGFCRTEQEELLVKKHPELTDRKLAWRRWKISEIEEEEKTVFSPDQIFQQEYPLTPDEAFLSSGLSVFSLAALDSFVTTEPLDIENGWKIWKKPSGYSIMAIDVSEGLANHDRTIIDIYDEHLEQVAQWAGWVDSDQVADVAIPMAERYNSFIIPEVNNMGIEVVHQLKKKYTKNKIYQREVFDEQNKKKVKRYGWRTTSKTKPILVSKLATFIRRLDIKFNCKETVSECMSFIRNGLGGYEADAGCNDDRVITAGLAIVGFMDHPPKLKKLTVEEKAKDDVDKANKQWRKDKYKKLKKLK